MEGQKLGGRYRIIELLGIGGMGKVYKAMDEVLDRYVAVKVMDPDRTKDDVFVRRFMREAKVMAKVTHPHVANIYDVGEEDDIYYLVMELIQGPTLKQVLREKGIFSLSEAREIMLQILSGMEAVHKHEVIHRDLKPQNIMLHVNGRWKVTDFGVSHLLTSETRLTQQGMLVGTIQYLSPEQAKGEAVHFSSDIYSLGVMLYEMVTGQTPFQAEENIAILLKHIQEPAPDPKQINPALTDEWCQVINKALEKEPAKRYQSIEEMRKALEKLAKTSLQTIDKGLSTTNGPFQTEGSLLNGRYQIMEKIGGGGMAKVYRGIDKVLEREVAVKIMNESLGEDEEFIRRFEREGKVTSKISHPHVVQILDMGNDGDLYYIVMELIQGPTLKQYLKEHAPLSAEEAIQIITQILKGLAEVHRNGVVHRDLKPQNLMLDKHIGWKVADFGLLRLLTSGTELTRTGNTLGTVHYLAPERYRGKEVHYTADIYALGVILYEMVTGQLPYNAEEYVAIIFKHIEEPIPDPRKINPDIPMGICQVIQKAMAKDPAKRYQSAEEMLEALANLGQGMTEPTEPEVSPEPTPPPKEKEKDLQSPPSSIDETKKVPWSFAFMLGVIAIILLGGMGYVGYQWVTDPNGIAPVKPPGNDPKSNPPTQGASEKSEVIQKAKESMRLMKGIYLKSNVKLDQATSQEEMKYIDEQNFYHRWDQMEMYRKGYICMGKYVGDNQWYDFHDCQIKLGLQDPKRLLEVLGQTPGTQLQELSYEYILEATFTDLSLIESDIQTWLRQNSEYGTTPKSWKAKVWIDKKNHRVKRMEQTIICSSGELQLTTEVLGEISEIKVPGQ
ncbi:protein kinase domain-containing protein [Thermoflavimicrobium dichotomicum]|uniref:Serine/threonine-protein kinase PrkC n=1 Tax=Thermoflavimicrobium dichotomicum TaxID=46223 RepID=A0A1I3RDH7_9BACL|nr:protein kinase [Thermoflavimicrobium dichotomicum]SFJ43411.1 Serine/threonine protein kinase [Thermoflavimicrobium dichotomicum]